MNSIDKLYIKQLEKELSQARADKQDIAIKQEAANKKLQKLNQELQNLNKEVLNRNEQLTNARLYAEEIINTIRDPLFILDKDLRVKRAAGSFYQEFNISEKETEGEYIYNLSDHQWDVPELRALLENILPAKKILEDIEITQIFPIIGKRTMCFNARQIDNINSEKLILLSIEDITAKRKVEEGLIEVERLLNESKERLKFAVDSAGLGTWDYNPQTKELIWDNRCKGIFDVPQLGLIDMSGFLELIHTEDRVRVRKSICNALYGTNAGEFDLEFRTTPVNEKVKWLKAKGRAYFNDKGEAIRFIGTLLEITAQKLIDEATKDLLSKKDEFISIASHELKTPITSLKAALQMIERIITSKEEMKPLQGFVQKGIKQVDKLVELIKDLLEVTKIQAGKLELKKTNFILDDLIAECCDELQVQSEKHQLLIEGEKSITIYADRNRLEQVIINLISNAVKYSPGSKKVIIRVSNHNNGVKVSIKDFGIGIPKDKLPFLFDRFFRVDETLQRYSGLGLGLYISAEIVRRHDGQIGIESTPGKGSTFWFTIPASI